MNLEGSKETKDLMKRASWLVQGFKPHSGILTSSVCENKELQKVAYF